MSAIVREFEHSFALPLFGIIMIIDLFQSCGHYWVFQICWHVECNTLTVSTFSIWNSSAQIPSPSLALFVVMLPKAHLTSHSRTSGSRWVITSLWLSGSWRSFFYSSSVFSCHLFLISEKAMAPHSSILAWKIPWMEEPGRLQSVRSIRVGHDWATSLSLFTFMHWRRKWQLIPVFLPGESQGQRSLVGGRLWGHIESDTTEVT